MVICSKHSAYCNEALHISLSDHNIASVEQQKLLGIIIDKNLTWEQQVNAACQNISRKLTLMKLLSKYVNRESLKQFYNSYVLPIFDYGCVVWGQTTLTNQLRLVRLQKRAARLILRADFSTPSELMFKELNWLSFPKRTQYHTCLMVYKSLNNKAPEYISSLLSFVSEHHARQTRSSANNALHIPRSKTTYFDKAFSVFGPKIWNSLPIAVRECTSVNSFKRKLRQYLLDTT